MRTKEVNMSSIFCLVHLSIFIFNYITYKFVPSFLFFVLSWIFKLLSIRGIIGGKLF
jgi:hypothetical protein